MTLDLSAMGSRLKQKRKKLRWTQEVTAEKLGITVTHYTAVENGKKDISKRLLIKISETLEESTDFILFGKINTALENEFLTKLNSLPPEKRRYAYNIMNNLLEALALDK